MDTVTYEIVYILNKNVTDFVSVEKQLTEWLGGKIEKIENLGNKKFSYPIQKQESGHYFLIKAIVQKDLIVEFQKKIRRMKEILRCLVINLDSEKHFRYSEPIVKSVDAKPFASVENVENKVKTTDVVQNKVTTTEISKPVSIENKINPLSSKTDK